MRPILNADMTRPEATYVRLNLSGCFRFMILLAIVGFMARPDAAAADTICIHPVPLTIKEFTDREKAGLMTAESVQLSAEYLTLKYCAAIDKTPAVISSVDLGGGCEMQSGLHQKEIVYWASCLSDIPAVSSAKPAREAPNEPLPGNLEIDPGVLRLVQTHRFFAEAPPVLVKAYKTVSELRESHGTPTTTRWEDSVAVRWLRPGIILNENNKLLTVTQSGRSFPSRSKTTEIVAANGFIEAVQRITPLDGSAGSNSCAIKLVSLDKLTGHIFPIEPGNGFSYEATFQQNCPQIKDAYKHIVDCNVAKKLSANLFNAGLTGDAHLVICNTDIAYKNTRAAKFNGTWSVVFFDALGIWLLVDPLSPAEQVSFTEQYTNGSHTITIGKLLQFQIAE